MEGLLGGLLGAMGERARRRGGLLGGVLPLSPMEQQQQDFMRLQLQQALEEMQARKDKARADAEKAAAEQKKAADAAALAERIRKAQMGVTNPDLGPLSALGKPPSMEEQAAIAAQMGGDAKTMAEVFNKTRPEFGAPVQVAGGQFVLPPKHGGPAQPMGYDAPAPKPEMQLVTLPNGAMKWVDKNTVPADTTYDPAMTPYQRAQVRAQNAAASAERSKADAMREVGGGVAQRETSKMVSDLRKEYNSLDAVKNYNAAAPLAKSVKTTPDTTAGDLDYIYAIGKVLDPGSVVREGEMQLVIKSGSPLERYKGDVRAIMSGKGRLTPTRRAELAAMLENRMAQLRKARDVAAVPYILQAKRNQLPEAEVFGEPSVEDLVEMYGN